MSFGSKATYWCVCCEPGIDTLMKQSMADRKVAEDLLKEREAMHKVSEETLLRGVIQLESDLARI